MTEKQKLQLKVGYKNARRNIFSVVLAFLYITVAAVSYQAIPEAQAAIPKVINFQGKLTAVSNGNNVANGAYAFEFKLYDASTSGTLLWTETYDQPSGACTKLTVTNGVFNAKLGSCNSLSSVDFTTGSLYLSVNFAPTGTSYDGEMSPRKQLLSSAFAFSANGVSGDGGVRNTLSSSTALAIAKAGTDYALQVDTSAGSAVTGLKVTSAAAAGGLALTTLSTGTNENLTLDAKGSGTVSINGSATGDVLLGGGSGSTGCTVTNSTGAFACSAGGTFTSLGLSGAITGATGISSSGTIAFSGLSSNGAVYTSGGTGTLTTTAPTSGAIGYLQRNSGGCASATTLCPATANDILSIPTSNTTGADLALTNTGVYTGTGIFNLTANSATTGTLAAITGNGLTTGSLLSLSSSSTAATTGQKGLNVALTGALTGAQTTYGGYFSNTRTGASAVNVGAYFTASGASGANYAAIFDQGNVGIGTTTPGYLLTVGSTPGTNQFTIGSDGTVSSSGFYQYFSAAYSGGGPNAGFTIANTGTAKVLSVETSNGNSGVIVVSANGTTAANGQYGIQTTITGTNSTSGVTSYGGRFINTHDGTTSTNIGLYATASGGTTANLAAVFDQGQVLIGQTTPTTSDLLYVNGSAYVTTKLTVQSGGGPYSEYKHGSITNSGTSIFSFSSTTDTIPANINLNLASGTGVFSQASTLTTTSPQTLSATALTTGVAQALTLGSALTTGGAYSVASASYNHGAATETGNLVNLAFTDATNGTATSTTNGIVISPTVNVTTGASGTKTINGVSITPTFAACTGGSTCNPNGLNVGNVTDQTGITSAAIKLGTGWDTLISGTTAGGNLIDFTNFKVTSAGVVSALTGLSSSGTINFSGLSASSAVYTDGSKNLTSTPPTSGTLGYWSRSGTTLQPATANDTISIANTTTTGADLALTNTGVYTGTGIFNLTANSATTGTLASITGNGLTTGNLLSLSSSSTAATTGQKGLNVALTGALTGAQTTYGGYFSNTRTGASAVNVGAYFTASGASGSNYAAIFDQGNVGIGTTTPIAALSLQRSGVDSSYRSRTYSSTNWQGNYLVGDRAEGSSGSPTDVTAGDHIIGVTANAYANSAFNFAGSFTFYVEGTPVGSNVPTYFTLWTSSTTGAAERLHVKSTGEIGVGTSGPDRQFEINSATGNNLRLTYNDADGSAVNYADLLTTAGGNLTIVPSGGNTAITGNLGITSANTTQTTTSSAFALNANSLTTGTGIYAASSSLTSGKLLDLQVNGTAAAASQTGLNIALQGTNGTSAITTYGSQISNAHAGTTSTNVALQLSATNGTTANYALLVPNGGGSVGIGTTTPTTLFDLEATNSSQALINATLSGGARSTNALLVTQANNASNDSSVALAQFTNNDTATSAEVLGVTQASGGYAVKISAQNGIGVFISGGAGAAYYSDVTDQTGLSLPNLLGGTGYGTGAGVTTGSGYTFTTTQTAMTTGSALRATGTASGALSAYTGKLIDISPTRTLTSGSINDTGSYLSVARANIVNGGTTYTVSGNVANLSSTCTQTSGTCTDTGKILQLTQSYATASGDVLAISNSGTGKDISGTSNTWNVTKAGVATFAGITSSGTIAFSGLSSNGAVYTSGGTGTLTTTAPTSGAIGYLQRNSGGCPSATTLCPATANDILSIPTTNTSGADLALTNNGVYIGTGIFNLTANNATTGTIAKFSGTALTTGKLIDITAGTALTTGSAINVSGASYNPGGGNTGNLINIAFTSAATNAASDISTVNGINIASIINSSGATGTHVTTGINIAAVTGTPTTGSNYNYGIHIGNQGLSGLNSSYGLLIDAQSGSTNNYGAYINGTSTIFADGIAPYQPTLQISKSTAVTTYQKSDAYIFLGLSESAINSTRLIGFGYGAGATNLPAYMGYITTSTASQEKGALVFGTRDVTTDTAASERMRIGTNGNVGIGTTGANALLSVAGNVIVGSGDNTATPTAQTLQGASVLSGTTNTAGAALNIAGGQGTGTGVGGNIVFQYAPAGSTGSTPNALQSACTISGTNGSLSCPGAGGSSERFGLSASAAGSQSLAVGKSSVADGTNATAVGYFATVASGSTYATAVGELATALDSSVTIGANAIGSVTATSSVLIGANSVAQKASIVAIGSSVDVEGLNSIGIGDSVFTTNDNVILIGKSAVSTASNQLVIGSSTSAMNDIYFGKGVQNATPTAYTIHGTGARGGTDTNTAGAALQLAGGIATGNAAGGNIVFQTSDALGSGTTAQSLTTKAYITATGDLYTTGDGRGVYVGGGTGYMIKPVGGYLNIGSGAGINFITAGASDFRGALRFSSDFSASIEFNASGTDHGTLSEAGGGVQLALNNANSTFDIKAFTGQTTNIQEWRNVGGTPIAVISNNGTIKAGQAAVSQSAWGTSGIQLQSGATTYTDTSTATSGTATNAVFNSFAQPTLAASNTSVTTTNAATVYIAAAPVAGTNQTITNPYSLWVDNGVTRLDGNLQTNITGSTQCVTADTNGVLSGTGSACGSGGGITINTTAITGGTGGRILYDNAGTVGEMTTTGSGTVVALATSPTFTTSAISPLFTNTGAMSLTTTASNGNISLTPNGTGTVAITSGVTTGTTTSSALSLSPASLSTGTGFYAVAGNSLTSGKLVDLQVSSTGSLTGQTALNIATAGTNGTGAQTTYGIQVANTHTGTSNNIGIYSTATGGTTNIGLKVASGQILSNANGALSTGDGPAMLLNGTWITGGTTTTTKPYVLIETSGATTNTWSTSGTGLGVNAATGFGGNIADFQINGSSKMSLSSGGVLTVGLNNIDGTAVNANGLNVTNLSNTIGWNNDVNLRRIADGQLRIAANGDLNTVAFRLGFGPATTSAAALTRDTVNGFSINSGSGTATFNDANTAGSGTVANRYIFGIAAPTLTATNTSVTDTVASTLYIGGAPTASTNTTIGTAYALLVNSGVTKLGGNLQTNITGSTQCVTADTNGVLSGTGSACGSGGGITINTTAITGGTGGRILYDNAGTVGEMTTTGSGTVVALATSPTFTTSAISPLFTNTGAMSLTTTASNGNISLTPNGTGTVAITSGVTTGTTTSSALSLSPASLSTGTGFYAVAGNSLTSGKLVDLQVSSTGSLTGQTALNIATAGTNGTGAQTTYGIQVANTHTGTSTNVAGYFTATGGTNNYAAIFQGGNVGIGTTAPAKNLEINNATGGTLRLTYNGTANLADLSVDSSGNLTLDSSSNRTIIAAGDFLKTSVAGVAGAAAGDIWYDSTAGKYKINEGGTTKIVCNTTDAGCGAGGSGARLDQITAATGVNSIDSTNKAQTWDWSTITTENALTLSTSGTGLTSGSTLKVTSATTGAVTNGIVQLTATGAFTGSGGLLNVTANSAATATIATFSGTGVTTGEVVKIIGGTAMTTGNDLEINNAVYVHTASETGNLIQAVYTDATTAAGLTTITNGISLAPTINATAGASTRTINGLSVTPTFTSCAAGTCAVNGVNIGDVVDGTGFTGTGLSIGSGWDAGLKFVESNPSNGTDHATISAPASITASYNWTLPSADSAGCLQSNGSGTLSIATCGDTNNQSFSNSGNATYNLPAGALMVIVEAFGSGGSGGGGAGSNNVAASRSGGGGGGGGSYVTSTFSSSSLGNSVAVTVGAGATGGSAGNNSNGTRGNPGNPSCFSTGANCTGTVYVRAFGGGGGGPGSVAGNTGAGGGGGGGAESVGANSTSGTGGAGGMPGNNAVGAANQGAGGGGGATSVNAAAVGGSSYYGGGGGAASSLNGTANGAAGGGAVIGGSGGGAGGGSPITTCALKAGGNGGTGQAISGGGGLGATTTGSAGANGATGVGGGGDGGGGGANGCATIGGAGGAGGLKGGGGGGGGFGNSVGGNGGAGGGGYVRVWTYRGQGADLAEIYGTNDLSLKAGDVVAVDSTMRAGVKKSTKTYDNTTIGVISTSPGLVIGNIEDPGATPVMVALAGRVPVKVNMENGAIHKGDYLTPSSIPGEAMKSVKAGLVIGQSMTDYTDSTAPGIVVAFIKSGPSNGSKLADILPDGLVSGSANPDTPEKTIEQRALAYLNSGHAVLEQKVDISEIFTDRLTAGLEVITPQLYANNVNIDNIHSMTGDNVGLILNSGGKFTIGGETVVNNADGTKTTTSTDPVITFDAQGNATFAGEITAASIIANKIDGIENLGARLTALETQITTTAQQVALDSLTSRVSALETPASVDLNTQNISGSLTVNGSTTALAGLVTNNISALGGLINMMSDVEFIGRPYFNTDTAGFALIRAGERSINVTFDQEYLEQPIVNATITVEDDPRLKTETNQSNIDAINLLKEVNIQNMFNADIRFLVVNKSEKGFTIILKDPAQQDVIFSWVALMVKGAKTFSSLTIPTPTPNPVVSGDTTPPVDTTPPAVTPPDGGTTPPVDTTPPAVTTPVDTTPPAVTPPVDTTTTAPPVGPPSPPQTSTTP